MVAVASMTGVDVQKRLRAYSPCGFCITPLHPAIKTTDGTVLQAQKKPQSYRVRKTAFGF